jgi:hypothetical protein
MYGVRLLDYQWKIIEEMVMKDYNAPTNRTLRWYRRAKHVVKDALSTLAELVESLGAR